MTLRPLAFAVALVLTSALTGCGQSAPPATPAASTTPAADAAELAAQLDTLYAEFWEESLQLNPLQATFIGDLRYNDRLPNFLSAEYRAQSHAFHQRWLERIEAIDPSALDGQARLSRDIFVHERKMALQGERFPTWMLPISQMGSIAEFAVQLGSGTGAQPFKTVTDYDNWLRRSEGVVAILDQAIANMREGVQAGVVQPKVLMQKVLPQLDAIIKDKPEDTDFWRPIQHMPEDFPEAERTRLAADYRAMIGEHLLPAYRRLRDYIAKNYLPACRDTVALTALPDGEAWYAYNVRNQTTTDLSPAQIHQIGLDEVARIHAEMRQVIQEVGFDGDLPDFFQFVKTDKRFEFDSEQALLDSYNALRARVEAKVPNLFSLLPKAGFEIRPVEPFRAASAAGGEYFPPSADGSRLGIFYVNTYDLPSRKKWDEESLFLHEAIPGHHFQIALQQELANLPAFRRFGGETAFVEGWGLYAESLGKELGVYTDPYQYFGRLQAELWRAIRLVVDTGLHSKGWTREQVIQYMLDNSAASETEAVSEAERYIAWPGQALAYKIGELKLQELRKRARTTLGDRFDIREFHAQVLKDGALPLAVLEAKIDRWLAEQIAR